MSKLNSPSYVMRLMQERGFAAKKRWGQNFLVDKNILGKIVEAAAIGSNDWVLEIGPGLGVLTKSLAVQAQKVISLEIDSDLVQILQDVVTEPNVEIIEADALHVNWKELFTSLGWGGEPVRLAANLPYYITTPLIMKALEGDLDFSTIVVMVQREVADRMAASPGSKDYGVLSLAVQYYTNAAIVANVPRTVFVPSPAVDSAIVKLEPQPPSVAAPRDELFQVIRASFQQRRKTIRNALKPLAKNWGITLEQLDMALERAGIEQNIRGERLSLEEFSELTVNLMIGV